MGCGRIWTHFIGQAIAIILISKGRRYMKSTIFNRQILALILLAGLSVFGFQNCSKKKDVNQIVQPQAFGSIVRFDSITTGSGAMDYTIEDIGSAYRITLNSYYELPTDTPPRTFDIQKIAVTRIFQHETEVLNLMNGTCEFELSDLNPPCNGCMAGTWTNRYVTDQNSTNQVQIFGLKSCTQPVDLDNIRTLILDVVFRSTI